MESIKCEICFHPFNIIKRRPRCLPCGHSFCSLCLKEIVNQNIITCPTCRQFYEIDQLKEIPINYSVEKLLGIDNGIELFSEFKTCNCEEIGESLMNCNKEKIDTSININFPDTDTHNCQCNITNPRSETSTTEEVWWLGKSEGKSPSNVNQQVDQNYSTVFDFANTTYVNPDNYCRNHGEEIEFYCLNHKEWICKQCTKECALNLKVECKIITKNEEKRGRKLEEESNSCTAQSTDIWWLGKELSNDTIRETDQTNPKKVTTDNLEKVTYCKIHNERTIYFCIDHQEWLCHICTLVMHPKHECTVITKEEELRGRKLKFYELSCENNCIKHNKEIVLFCLNHKEWICKKCTYEDHPKHKCTVISKEEELRGKKREIEEKIKMSIIKYDQLISNLHNWFINEEKTKNYFEKLSKDVKHKDNVIKNILDQAEENKWRLELTLQNLCVNGTCEEVQGEYNNVTELVTAMMNWEQQQQHWLSQKNKQCDDKYCCQEVKRQIIDYEKNNEELTTALQSGQMRLQLSEEQQLSLRQNLLHAQLHTEVLRRRIRNTFVLCSILCLSVIFVSLWVIGSMNSGIVMNEWQNKEVILQNQTKQKRFNENYVINLPMQKRFNEKCVINKIIRNNNETILKLERHLIDSLDQKYKLQMKYDETIRQFNYVQLKMKEVLNERNEIIRKLDTSNSTMNETKPREILSYDYLFIKNYLEKLKDISTLITESFYWALCLNLSFSSFFIAVYISFSFDIWFCFQTRKCNNEKLSYIFFVFQVYLMFCVIENFFTWITGIELSVGTPPLLSLWSHSLTNSWLHIFLTILTGSTATGISAVFADGIGRQMKSAGYHSDYCHCTVVIAWFLLMKEFSLISSWVADSIDMKNWLVSFDHETLSL
ncbi:unnamed protein product [Meganyctiphanes norvegica]|uniref:RING-type domain-containing protein n=1 Tax=Meganyctiphanes norvegica TaxID=48144 RepID=A0AAV2R2S9_MEGNR